MKRLEKQNENLWNASLFLALINVSQKYFNESIARSNSIIALHEDPTVLFEDNATCVAQIKECYVKSDRTKHIPLKFFSYSQELEKNNDIDIQYIRSSNNATDLFTNARSTTTFRKHIHIIRKRHLCDLCGRPIHVNLRGSYMVVLFFPYYGFQYSFSLIIVLSY